MSLVKNYICSMKFDIGLRYGCKTPGYSWWWDIRAPTRHRESYDITLGLAMPGRGKYVPPPAITRGILSITQSNVEFHALNIIFN